MSFVKKIKAVKSLSDQKNEETGNQVTGFLLGSLCSWEEVINVVIINVL